MRHRAYLLALAALFCLQSVSSSAEINDFAGVATAVKQLGDKHGAANVLLVSDIDNTLLAGKTDLGSVQWYRWQSDLLKNAPTSPALAAKDQTGLLEVQGLLYASFPMRLTQPELPDLVKQWKEAGFPVMALTSRGYGFRDSTRRELHRHGLKLTTAPGKGFPGPFDPYSLEAPELAGLTAAELTRFELGKPRAVSYAEGVYMTAGQHKGVMLRTLLKRIGLQPKAIVFVDDQPKHITEMEDAFAGSEIELRNFRYGREDRWALSFSKSQSRKQRCSDDLRTLQELLARISKPEPETLNVVEWNAQSMFSVEDVAKRADSLKRFAREQKPDILILDEVTSLDVVQKIAEVMGLNGFHAACSDFAQDDTQGYKSLEVGVLSRYPLDNVLEYDSTPDNTGAPGEPREEKLTLVELPGLTAQQVTRGFLAADIPALGLTVIATHLKSARGAAGAGDHANARKREFVAAAIAKFAADRMKANPNGTILLGGDINVGETDRSKNGTRLEEDHYLAADGDLYDDTQAIFKNGLVDGLYMHSLTTTVGETYNSPDFPGTGPIDCLYVTGAQSSGFSLARKGTQTYGSDHFPVATRFNFSGEAPVPLRIAPKPPAPMRIAALLPNPEGEDEGKEYVILKNETDATINLDGWKMRDRANHAIDLADEIAAGQELKVELKAGEMPLNNGGDDVELLSADGAVVQRITYGGGQTASGVEIKFPR